MFIDYAFLRASFAAGLAHGLEPAHGIIAVALLFLGVRATVRHVCLFGLSAFLGQFVGTALFGLAAWAGAGESGVKDATLRNIELGLRLGGAAIVLAVGWALWRARRAVSDPSASGGATSTWCALILGQAVGLLQCRVMLPSLMLSIGQRQVGQGLLSVALFAAGLVLVLTVAALLAGIARRRLDAAVRRWPRMRHAPVAARGLLVVAGAGLALQPLITR